jgi:hypothetical protein
MRSIAVLALIVLLLVAVVLCYRYDDYDYDDYEPTYHSRRHRRRRGYSNVLGGGPEIEMTTFRDLARRDPVPERIAEPVLVPADPMSDTNLAFIFSGGSYAANGAPIDKKLIEIGGGLVPSDDGAAPRPIGDRQWTRFAINERYVIWENEARRTIVFAFRGSDGKMDWLWTNGRMWLEKKDYYPLYVSERNKGTDFTCGTVSTGFIEHFELLRSDFQPKLNTIREKLAEYKVIVTGHSLGAVIAHYGALVVALLYQPRVQLISFGSPRAGNVGFISCFNAYVKTLPKRYITRTFTVDPNTRARTEVIDPVTAWPIPRTPSFMHVKSEDIILDCDIGDATACHRYMGYLDGLKKANLVPFTRK